MSALFVHARAALRRRSSYLLLHILAAAAFAIVYAWVLFPIARFYWFVPAGWRFAALALLPLGYWPWILGGEFLARVFAVAIPWHHGNSATDLFAYLVSPAGISLIFAGPLLALPGSVLLRWRSQASATVSSLATPSGMGWMLFACLVCALGETVGNLVYVHFDTIVLGLGVIHFILGKFTGDYIGVIALAPALFAFLPSRNKTLLQRGWSTDAALLLAFSAAYIVAMRMNVDTAVYEYARILVLIPVFIAAFRHGWRAGAIALTICSGLVTVMPAIAAVDPYRNLFTQMLLALAGSAALLLGSAIDAQRRSREVLAAQNVNLDRLGIELREAAQRNLRLEEEQHRRLAAEIHDELGQNLTAVHTRVKLAAERMDAAQLGDVTTSIYAILATMRRSVRGLMDSLRPPVLDEFGLVRALREGPLRDLVETAGLRYEFVLRGEPALITALEDATQIAIWRIVQEAATNTVKHAQAGEFRARLRIGVRDAHALVIIDLRDDGIGIDAARSNAVRGFGVQGIHDRAIALDGRLHIFGAGTGTRLHVLLRQAL